MKTEVVKPKEETGPKKGGKKKKVVPATDAKRTIEIETREVGDMELQTMKNSVIYGNYSYYLQRLTEPVSNYFDNALSSDAPVKAFLMDNIFKSDLFTESKLII